MTKAMEISENVKKLIEDDSKDLDDSSEIISEGFTCCVCLDLLYKPVVLACGHVSCFWCVHKSMSGLRESHCPICRHSYHHFPTICQMLHFMLLKICPLGYKRREIQTLEYEKENDCFSPQLNVPVCMQQTGQEIYHVDNSQRCGVSGLIVEDSLQMPVEDAEASSIVVNRRNDSCQRVSNGTCQKITVDDALCMSCSQLVYRPIVLNCGHVYCESCVVVQTNDTIECLKCRSTHPGQAPKVCLELNNFLNEQFPAIYALKRSSAQQVSPRTCSADDTREENHSGVENSMTWWGDSKVHVQVGCDFCGMYPIIGDRYRCKDCVESIGFDLCGDCYKARSKLPGRFNQQHTPEHQFEIMRTNSIRNIMIRLLRGQLGVVSPVLHVTGDVSENTENVVPFLSDDTQETADSGFVTPMETEEDQSNHQNSI